MRAILAGILAGAGGTLGAIGIFRDVLLLVVIGVAVLAVGWTMFRREFPE